MPDMKIPGPDHPIALTAAGGRMRAHFQGHVIADSADVLMLKEADYPAVAYFPRADVDMAYMGRSARSTHCPYKGDASYYTLTMDGHIADNAVWSYETPYPAMAAIAGRLAFYPNIVALEAAEPERAAESPDQVVQHTDSGSGAPQRQAWPANTDGPGGEA